MLIENQRLLIFEEKGRAFGLTEAAGILSGKEKDYVHRDREVKPEEEKKESPSFLLLFYFCAFVFCFFRADAVCQNFRSERCGEEMGESYGV